MLVSYQVGDQPQERGAVAVDQHFERVVIAEVRLLKQDVIRQVRILPAWREVHLHTIPLSLALSESRIIRMSHGRYPCSQQTHESPTNAPETEQQQRDHEAPSCRLIYY